MGNKVFTYKDKAFNTIYRLIIFICFAGALAAVYGVLSIVATNGDYNENLVRYTNSLVYGYYVLLIGSAAAVIFSAFAYKSGGIISLIFRTLFSVGIFMLEICGHKIMSVGKFLCDITNKYGYEYLNSHSPEELGLTQSDIEKLENIDNTDGNLMIYVIWGIFLAVVIYFILSLTSLHSLFKQRKIPVSSGVPMDDELAQYYDNSNSGYDNINNL